MKKVIVNYHHSDSLAQVILNAPKANILDSQMMQELLQLFEEFHQHQGLKLITIEGAGQHFSFGASVDEHTRDKAAGMLQNFHKIFYRLMDLNIPTIAKVDGMCLGGGCELALMCNMNFATQSAKFGQPEISLGVFPPPASVILPLKIGQARADELLISGRNITAEQALTLGLVNKIFTESGEMESAVDDYFQKFLLPKSASSLKFAVRAARSNFNTILRQNLAGLETMYIEVLMQTFDANEGIESFLQKRKPEWKNK